jgi:hypothetical protein
MPSWKWLALDDETFADSRAQRRGLQLPQARTPVTGRSWEYTVAPAVSLPRAAVSLVVDQRTRRL